MHRFSFLQTTYNVIKRRLFSNQDANPHLKVNSTLKYTEWTGQKNQNWSDEENWSDGLPFRHLHAYIPRVPRGNHFPDIKSNTDISFTIKNEGIISNFCNISITLNGLLQNYGIVNNAANAQLINLGKLVNHGTIKNIGLISQRNIFCNFNIVENTGTIVKDKPMFNLKPSGSLADIAPETFPALQVFDSLLMSK